MTSASRRHWLDGSIAAEPIEVRRRRLNEGLRPGVQQVIRRLQVVAQRFMQLHGERHAAIERDAARTYRLSARYGRTENPMAGARHVPNSEVGKEARPA